MSKAPEPTHDPVNPWEVGVVKAVPYRFPVGAEDDHPKQRLDVYIPPHLLDSAGEWEAGKEVTPAVPLKKGVTPAPVLLYIHGGAWMRGDRDYFYSVYQSMGRLGAANGFVTVVPSYRLSPEVKYPEHNRDAAAALHWTRAHAGQYGGDPNTMILAGNSAGGHIAAMLALSEEFSVLEDGKPAVQAEWLKGVALGSPVVDVARLHLAPMVAIMAKNYVFDWTGNQEYLEAVSPITYVDERVRAVKWFLVNAEEDYHLHLDALDLLTEMDKHEADVWYNNVAESNHTTIMGLGNAAGMAAPDFVHSMMVWAHQTVGPHPGLRVSPIVVHVPPPKSSTLTFRKVCGYIWSLAQILMLWVIQPVSEFIEWIYFHPETAAWPKQLRPSGAPSLDSARHVLSRRAADNSHKWRSFPVADPHPIPERDSPSDKDK